MRAAVVFFLSSLLICSKSLFDSFNSFPHVFHSRRFSNLCRFFNVLQSPF